MNRRISSKAAQASETLFDDFNYANHKDLAKHGWIVRTAEGWPGIPGAIWRKQGVSFINDDSEQRGNRILCMTSTTDGTAGNTTQTQICQQRKFMEGTYAARVRFVDNPSTGPSGDQLVESFYAISPLKAPMDPDYSELDFECLPNGGWGSVGPTLYVTSWRTFSPEPNWQKDNVFYNTGGSKTGWHTLVTQVAQGKVKYFLAAVTLAEHGDKYYPRSIMSINFNLWFIKDQLVQSKEMRAYQEDIDWVFYEAKSALTPQEIEAKVAAMRRKSVRFNDTVRAPSPALLSPCNF